MLVVITKEEDEIAAEKLAEEEAMSVASLSFRKSRKNLENLECLSAT